MTRPTLTLTKLPMLKDCRTKDLESALDYMIAEVDACGYGIEPETSPVFEALCMAIDIELRLRNPNRRRPRVIVKPRSNAARPK